jgi:hypothetical protein
MTVATDPADTNVGIKLNHALVALYRLADALPVGPAKEDAFALYVKLLQMHKELRS